MKLIHKTLLVIFLVVGLCLSDINKYVTEDVKILKTIHEPSIFDINKFGIYIVQFRYLSDKRFLLITRPEGVAITQIIEKDSLKERRN
jgi:hypothetical protein